VVAPEPPRTPAALRPPDEKELEALASVLEALASPDKSTAALTALGQGRPFSLERFGVLVADVRSVVVQLHARELRARLVRGKELDAETREQLDRDLKVMEGCAPGRFQSRGGSVVFDLVVTLVGKHRARLEPQLFQAPAPPVPKPDAAKPDAPEPKQSR